MSHNDHHHHIPLAEAIALTANYRTLHPGEVKAFSYNREVLDEILSQPGCSEIRIYFGQTHTGEIKLVLTGVDELGNDLFNGVLAEYGDTCPPTCPINSPLNQ
jgi:hypothetical protein